jgi:outer membrane receptor protein involved in Fe transport
MPGSRALRIDTECRLIRRWVCLVAVLSGAIAHAQQPEAPSAYKSTVHARPKREESPQIVITAKELQQRGALTLAEALDLIPEVQVRQGGMGTRLDLRGAKQFSILLLIDGVPIDEPYFGAFDLNAIPITDIVEIRVQLAPASPLEGPGGDGGIVEVFTLRARGNRRLDVRAVGGSTPEAEVAVTGRTPLSERVAMRASASGHVDEPAYPVINLDQSRTSFVDRTSRENASLRFEYETGRGRLTADAWYGHRAFFIPPSETVGVLLQDVTDEHAARAVLGGELNLGAYRLAIGAYAEMLKRETDYYKDFSLSAVQIHQSLTSGRVGGAAIADRTFSSRGWSGTVSARLSVDGAGATVSQTMQKDTFGFATYGELAVGARARWRWLTLEGAVGALVPFANPGGTWPEAKLVVGFQPHRAVSVLLIGARKGRLPTTRELFDPLQGNPKLNPEQTWHGEVQVSARPHPLVAARLSGYLRKIEGMIRLDPSMGIGNMSAHNINLDDIDVRGLETGIDVAQGRIIGGGLTYIFEDAHSESLGFDAIQNFPRHRFDAYLASTWKRRVGGLLRFRWVSERSAQGTLLPRYQVLELSAWAKINERLRASVRVDNLLNQPYLLLPGLSSLGTTVTATIEGVWE